jgi:hypothetical protein
MWPGRLGEFKATQTTGKNIVWLKNIQGDTFSSQY